MLLEVAGPLRSPQANLTAGCRGKFSEGTVLKPAEGCWGGQGVECAQTWSPEPVGRPSVATVLPSQFMVGVGLKQDSDVPGQGKFFAYLVLSPSQKL